jgi:thiol-disulfide isomerase/thioredoxin
MSKIAKFMRGKTIIAFSIVLAALVCVSAISSVAAQTPSPESSTAVASAKYPPYPVNLYEFYSSTCPHCAALAPTIAALESQYPTLHVYRYEIGNNENYSLFTTFRTEYGLKFDTVPTVVIGKEKYQGDEYAPQIKAAVAQGVQNGATGPGDVITGHIVPTPTPSPTTHCGPSGEPPAAIVHHDGDN